MKKETILIVDDNDSLRHILKTYLKKAKYEILEASNGLEAIKQLQKDKSIGLVLMDMMMPEMTGSEFLTKIKKYKKALEISICMITAVGTSDVIFKALASGADDYIVKPVEKDLLLEKVASFLQHKSTDQFFRLKMDLPGSLLYAQKEHSMKVKDMTEGDLGFTCSCEIEMGASVGIFAEFMDHMKNHAHEVHLVRIYARESAGRDGFFYHASFIAPEDNFTKKMRSFVMLNKAEQEKEKLRLEELQKQEMAKLAEKEKVSA